MTFVKSIAKIDVANVLTKGLGYGALGLVAYDAHTYGKIESSAHKKHVKTESIEESFMHDMKQETPSIVESKLKHTVFDFKLNENVSGFFTSITGYFNGFGKMLVHNVVPLTLAAGTVLSPKGLLSKAFGAGLLVYGGIYFAQNVLGFGHHE